LSSGSCPQCKKRLGNSVIAVHAPHGEVTHLHVRLPMDPAPCCWRQATLPEDVYSLSLTHPSLAHRWTDQCKDAYSATLRERAIQSAAFLAS
jgi:hypothetical protein